MRPWSVFLGNYLGRLVCGRWFGLAVYQVVVLVLATGLVWAGEDSKQEAKARYSAGQSHYNLNEFQDALREFKEAYRLYPDPAFLFNAAQCERQLGHTEESIQFYRSYLRNASKAPNRQEVEHRIEELQATLEARKAVTPAVMLESPATTPARASSPAVSPTAPVEGGPEAREEASVPVVPSRTMAATALAPANASEPSEQRPGLLSEHAKKGESAFYQHWWFWTGVAVLAAGIGVGVYAMTAGGSGQAPSSQLGTKTVF